MLAGSEFAVVRAAGAEPAGGDSVRADAGAARVAEAGRSAGAAARLTRRQARGLDGYYEKAIAMLQSPKLREAFNLQRRAGEGARGVRAHDLRAELSARAAAGRGGDEVRHRLFLRQDRRPEHRRTAAGTRTASTTRACFRSSRSTICRSPSRRCRRCSIDLDERGLLDDDAGRLDGRIWAHAEHQQERASRDHWPQCYTTLLAGGGVKRGFVYGASRQAAAHIPPKIRCGPMISPRRSFTRSASIRTPRCAQRRIGPCSSPTGKR